MDIYKDLCDICDANNVLADEPMKKHTTLKVGGNARFYVIPDSYECVKCLITYLRENHINYYIIGNGSNLCVRDEGFDGVIVDLHKNMNLLEINGEYIRAFAGVLLSSIGNKALSANLTGFEALYGIPGCVGGAIAMNAGAYGSEIKDCLVECTCIDKDGNIITIDGKDMDFSYRHSRVLDEGLVVLEGVFKLSSGNYDDIKAAMYTHMKARKDKQPLEYPSAGSTFKRPVGYFAGKLIEEAGLRGKQIGGMQVSNKHCGFVVNVGDGTADDFISLVEYVKKTVYENSGVMLELEVRII